MHYGIDLVPKGTSNILAMADGTVVESTYLEKTFGEVISIEHSVGGKIYRTTYAHLLNGSRLVFVGDNVSKGQQIGIMGNTGYSKGTHLHLVVKIYSIDENKFIHSDPANILNNLSNSTYDTDFDNDYYYDPEQELPYNPLLDYPTLP